MISAVTQGKAVTKLSTAAKTGRLQASISGHNIRRSRCKIQPVSSPCAKTTGHSEKRSETSITASA